MRTKQVSDPRNENDGPRGLAQSVEQQFALASSAMSGEDFEGGRWLMPRATRERRLVDLERRARFHSFETF